VGGFGNNNKRVRVDDSSPAESLWTSMMVMSDGMGGLQCFQSSLRCVNFIWQP